MPNVCNWWCKIGPVDDDDIDTIHEILAHTKKNKVFDPTLSSYVPNTLRGIQYAITGVYLETVEENKQVPYMKVSFPLHKLNQIVQFFLIYIYIYFSSYSFNLMNENEKNRY
jgi:cytochrome b subunit of formate dehydrogenase